MADFEKAFRITILGNEGGYNPGIGEEETYIGVDRGANPHWIGWRIIDNIKAAQPGISTAKMNVTLATNNQLQAEIRTFYKANYWDTVKLDNVIDQQLANNLFDCSVNQGDGIARKFMQGACNIVLTATNAAIKLLVIDMVVGPGTLSAINTLPAAKLMDEINALRWARYQKSKGFAEWGDVWKRRLLKYKV